MKKPKKTVAPKKAKPAADPRAIVPLQNRPQYKALRTHMAKKR